MEHLIRKQTEMPEGLDGFLFRHSLGSAGPLPPRPGALHAALRLHKHRLDRPLGLLGASLWIETAEDDEHMDPPTRLPCAPCECI